ncbi:hypothetical protein Q5P01_002979 [Channa striata]|uniref:Ig-like domain-containing protein n=1 Tax=Channa striata TaxID=64152 RepID=A0AA88T4A0_CHASR|nr:hypothetical protein Q5P01_002979 [Channa striata]
MEGFYSDHLSLCLCGSCPPGQLNITAHPGENITLPCQASISKPFIAVEWTRPDLTQYVFFFRGQHIVKNFQHPSFVDRVDLLDRQMKDGNLSLSLRNVTSSDHGTYECRVKEKEDRDPSRGIIQSEPINVVRLTVTGLGEFDNRWADGLVGLAVGLPVGFLLLLFVAGGFVVYRKCSKQGSYPLPAEQDDEIQI